jgi:hypothetical protein
MGPSAHKRLRRAQSVHTRTFDGELVILDLERGEYLTLDAIGSLLWAALEEGRSLDEVAHTVVAEYDVTLEQATADLEALMLDLLRRGLFVEDRDP